MTLPLDRRTFLSTSVATAVALGATAIRSGQPASATPQPSAEGGRNALLRRWFEATYRSVEALTTPFGLPADNLDITKATPVLSKNTSPTNIGCGLWSTAAAGGLGVISRERMSQRIERTISAVERLQRAHGFWFNWYDPETGAVLTTFPPTGAPIRPFLSTVDNAWLVTGLRIAADAVPALRPRTHRLIADCDWSFFYNPFDAADPVAHPGQLRGGFNTDDGTFTAFHFGAFNTEPRMASYHGLADGSLPFDHYWRMFRTLPPDNGQEQPPQGGNRTVDGVEYFNGHYVYRGRALVPTWGGSMFEALMVPMFVPEPEWSPHAWGVNHSRYVRSQIDHGMAEAGYGYWGFSPCNVPEGGYQEYGVDAIGQNTDGYASNTDRTFTTFGEPLPPRSAFTNGVATPHASFLALPYAESEAIANLRALADDFGAYHETYGFHDSVNVSTGRVSDFVLALDQGMIAAALAQRLHPGLLQRPFRTGGFASRVRPLIQREDFGIG